MTSVVPYRLSMKKNIGRKSKKSVVASAAYIARERIKDRESGKIYDYRKGYSEVLFSKIFTPDIVPEWAHNRGELWNKVQETEFRKDAQYARSLELSLPHEFSHDHMVKLIEDFVRDNFTSKGMIADVALHKPDKKSADNRNYHAHILLTLREVNDKCFGYKVREWNHLNQLRNWREDLALKLSEMFERPEYLAINRWLPERWLYSHLTLIKQRQKALERGDFEYAQACNHKPTKHKGVEIYHMEKRGIESYVEKNRNAKRNLSRQKENIQIQEMARPIYSNMEIYHDDYKISKLLNLDEEDLLTKFYNQKKQQREQEKADRAIDDEIMQRFGHLDSDLKNGNKITPEKRAQLLKALEYSKQAEKDLELEREKDRDDYERDR